MFPRLAMASGPTEDRGQLPPKAPHPPEPFGDDPSPRPRAFEISPGLRTSILFGLGLVTLSFEFFVRPFLGLDPAPLVIAAGLTLLGLPLFLGLPGGGK